MRALLLRAKVAAKEIGEELAMMEAVRAARPELDLVGHDPEAAPAGRPRDVAATIAGAKPSPAGKEGGVVIQLSGLPSN